MDDPIDKTIREAKKAQADGKLSEAQTLYQQILDSKPQHAETNYLLGNLLLGRGEVTKAAPFLVTSISHSPTHQKCWVSYINCLIEGQKFFACKVAIEQAKRSGFDHEEIALLASKLETVSTAQPTRKPLTLTEKRARSALRKRRKKPDSKQNIPADQLVDAFIESYQEKRLAQAEKLARDLTCRFPEDFFGWKALGVTLQQGGRLVESLPVVFHAAGLNASDFEAQFNLGVTLQRLNFLTEAEETYQTALSLQPKHAEAHNNLGVTQLDQRKFEKAESNFRRAVALHPNFPMGFSNLGNALKELGRLEEAIASYQQAILLEPDYAEAHTNLGNCLRDLGEFAKAEASYKRAVKLAPELPELHSNLLMLLGSMRFSADQYLVHAHKFADLAAKKVGAAFTQWQTKATPDRLHIGFVSGDFRSHPVGYFFEGLLAELRGSSLVLLGYPTYEARNDQVGTLIARSFDHWYPIANLDDEQAAKKMHQDRLDILIDLSGHTNKSRLPIFAWRPAPVQATWLGYFASTGLPEMDFVIGDAFVTPPEEELHFVERVWRLPDSYLCFTPPHFDIEVGSLPAYSNEFITFGCFNKISRMTDEVVAVRAEILKQVPESKLFLKDQQLASEDSRQEVASRFAAHGISAQRLILEGHENREQYLRCYNRVDIGLSPFPYGGGTTVAESLWMGTPVIARKGNYFLSHIGESILNAAGLGDWVAADNDEFVHKAVQFSANRGLLAELQQKLRSQALTSPLFDAKSFAKNLEKALWGMASSHRENT